MHRDIDTALLRAFIAVVENRQRDRCRRAAQPDPGRGQPAAQTSRGIVRHAAVRAATIAAWRCGPTARRLLTHAHKLIALNDEVWGAMSAPRLRGRGAPGASPHDIVGPYLPPILRRFDQAWPRGAGFRSNAPRRPQLLELLRKGDIDLTLTTEQRCGAGGKTLSGGRIGLGRRHERRPRMAATRCRSRSATKSANSGRSC